MVYCPPVDLEEPPSPADDAGEGGGGCGTEIVPWFEDDPDAMAFLLHEGVDAPIDGPGGVDSPPAEIDADDVDLLSFFAIRQKAKKAGKGAVSSSSDESSSSSSSGEDISSSSDTSERADDGTRSDGDASESLSAEPRHREPGMLPRAARTELVTLFMDNGMGSIRYSQLGESFRAYCPVHGAKCKRSRTIHGHDAEARSAQGRPLGDLAAWLLMAADFPSAKQHKTHQNICYTDRNNAREQISVLAKFDVLTDLERKLRVGERAEPRRCP